MLVRLGTKRDRNGNRYFLIIDHENKTYSKQPLHWLCRDDFIEVSKKDYRRYIDFLETFNYKETEKAL